ncbi:Ca2+-binding EF-hand superfamily protein [Wenyingzhuangia heitensis]|uniref:Ca2+-binding EF-hand superfamily protein n=1 Tax=Wenyingzhuangia heitensis TaxID=1487859 RepID=A0ABX0UC45_9FLAO|nr:EF-hand domain-containing protein [Wenyingzhuangia heitensis]NIJ46399.1 Ca2+-binding EF-hand superfamily protein [Wenyingzhuangia heitensis]
MKSQKITIIASAICILTSVASFSQEKEKPSPEKWFKNLDKNKDGKLTKAELEGKKIENKFDAMDKDGNGSVVLEEFLAFAQKGKKPNVAKKPMKIVDESEDTEDTEDGGEE